MILVLVASTLLHLCCGQSMVANLHISEHGSEYDQRVEYDPTTKAVTYFVPKHHDIVASSVIIHKPTDTMIEFDPEARICNLKSVPEDYDPDLAVIHAFSLSANNKTITPEDAVPVFQLNYHKGPISAERRRGLLESMQTLCKDVVINEIESIRVSEEEFLQRSFDPSLHSNSTRVKRRGEFFTCRQVNDRCTPQKIGIKCIWYTVSSVGSSDRWQLDHVRSGDWACTRCCDDRADGPMCHCDDINDNDSFVKCQRGLYNSRI